MRHDILRRRLTTIALAVLLLAPPTTTTLATGGSDGTPVVTLWDGNYTPRAPYHADYSYSGLPGNGTAADPYVLEGYLINGTSTDYPLKLSYQDKHLVVRNNTFQDVSYIGVSIYKCTNITFENNIIRNFRGYGMNLVRVDTVAVKQNQFINNTITGDSIYVGSSTGVQIEGNGFDTEGDGIFISQSMGIAIRNNTLNNTSRAVNIGQECDGIWIENNTLLSGVGYYGIELFHSVNCTIAGNTIANSQISIRPATMADWLTMDIRGDNIINGINLVSLIGVDGRNVTGPYSQVFIQNSTNISIDCSKQVDTFYGLVAVYSRNVRVFNGTLTGGGFTPLLLHGSNLTASRLEMNRIELEADGEQVHIDNCTSTGSYTAISISGTDCSIRDSIIGPPIREAIIIGRGFFFGYRYTDNLTISNNTITFDTFMWTFQHVGVWVSSRSVNLTIKGNRFTTYGIRMPSASTPSWTSHVIIDNTLNGTPIIYYANQRDLDITGKVGQLILANCSSVRVHDVEIKGSEWPVQVALCDNLTFERSSFSDSPSRLSPVSILTSNDIEVKRNEFINLTFLQIIRADRVMIWQNVLKGARIELGMVTDCTVRNNHIMSTGHGIYLTSGSDITISHNQFEGCGLLAMKVEGSRYETPVLDFHHNNLVDNNENPATGKTISPQCNFTYATVAWDDDAEGNYWSEYPQRYPAATNDSNVWDTPYDIVAGSTDRYPLVQPVDAFAPVAGVDSLEHVVDQDTMVVFNASTSTDNMGVTNYTWALEYDGRSIEGHGAEWSFFFELPGVYVVHLTVRDAEGNWDELEVLVVVLDTESPVADAGPDVHVDQGANVTLDGSGSTDNVGIADWNWTFPYNGSDVELHGESTNWIFDTPGVYTVNLTVTDASDHTGADAMNVTVRDTAPPTADAGEDQSVPFGTNVSLDGSSSSDNVGITSHRWTFVYDNISAPVQLIGEVVHFTFELAGRFDVELLVTDVEGNEATDIVVVTVIDDEPPVIVTEGAIDARTGAPVAFDAEGSTDNAGIAGYEWTFTEDGQNVTLEGPRPSHTFATSGVYAVRLRVTDVNGNVAETVVTVTVRDLTVPVADAGPDVDVDQGTTVTLDGSGSTDDVGVTGWEWTFEHAGQAVTLEGVGPQFTFTVPGVYEITLRVVDADGNADTDTANVTVNDTEDPVARATVHDEVRVEEPFTLDGSASTDNVGVVRWAWTVRLGVDTVKSPEGSHVEVTLDAPGAYNITLVVHDAAGNTGSTDAQVIVVSIEAPMARAGEDVQVEAGDEHAFDASGTTSVNAIESYVWTFRHDDQDVTLEGAAPSFTFIIPGNYSVALTILDDKGLTDADTVTVTVVDTTPPVPRLKVGQSDDSRRRVLDGSDSEDLVGVVNWTWEIVFENEITHLYGPTVDLHRTDPGRYEVTLTVRDAAGNEAYDGITVTLEGGSDDDGGLSVALVGGILAVVIAAVVAAVVVMMRRRSG